MNKKLQKLSLLLLLVFGMRVVLADPVYIDVRTPEEYTADHIDGDTNMPMQTFDVDKLAAKYGKDADIVLYCRTGHRAGLVKEKLDAAGFTNVKNGGGIGDQRELRHLAASSPAK